MDVDLLRPGTVPISPDTVLWFEFLLDPNLLLNHLEKPKPDPTATDLIIKFTTSILDSIKNDVKRLEDDQREGTIENITDIKPRDSLKNLALKILSLKIAAHMKWNLDLIETKIPVKIQICLLQDLIYFTNEKRKVEIPNIPESDLLTISDQHLFALVIYHRWLIRMIVQRSLNMKITKTNGDMLMGTIDDFFICTPELIMTSVNFLTAILSLHRTPKVLTFETFIMLNEDTKEIDQEWDKSIEIPRLEFESQIYYDLGCFYFHREEYNLAKKHFLKCSECFYNLDPDIQFVYASFDMHFLNGFLYACNVPVEGFIPSLLQQMNASIVNQYTGILSILQEDNKIREIPVIYRTILELDIQGALSSGKFTVARDLLLQVQMLNVVRYVLEGQTSHTGDFLHRLKYGGVRALDILFWAVNSVLESCCDGDREIIKIFFMKLLMTEDIPELFNKITNDPNLKLLLTAEDVELISKAQIKVDDIYIPDSLKSSDWLFPDFSNRRNPYLEAKSIEQKLIACYSPKGIRELLVKLSATNQSKPVWRLNLNWELPIPLQSVVMSMPRGFIQDFSYILLAKARELININNFDTSIELLTILDNEVKAHTSITPNTIFKLCRLINWEALLVNIAQLIAEWPANHINKQQIVAKCQACLSALDGGDSVIPRLEVVEQCALCLLNLAEWEYLCGLDKRWNYFEMAAAVAYACQDLTKYKGNKKVSRDMWDLVLPIFGSTSTQTKRSSTGNTTILHRDSPTINSKANLVSFLSGLRDITALSVVISMLARLYNVLKDESSLELIVEYIILWPAVVSNANSYNTKAVCEVLSQLVLQALKHYPSNTSWLKLMGDINFGNAHYETALKYYLETLIVATDYFNQFPGKPSIVDDHIFKRMIKCCTQINCHTQAAILYQFLDEIDYGLAFKCLGENKSTHCNDAIDAYYNCIWDTTILEYLVHLHHKRGENHRKQQAVKAIGMLELNSNNNEEIQREAMNVRKSRFLRALTKQYLSRDL